jgi:hypothetical protein
MQGALQVGPTLYNQPEAYAEHLRNTGRAHLADDLMERLHPHNGATHVSWHAQQPISPEDRARMRRRFEAMMSTSK